MSKYLENEKQIDKNTICGLLRINQKRYTDAYIDNPEQGPDIFVESRRDALDGDLVQVSLNPPDKWKLKFDAIVTKWESLRDELMPVIDTLRNLTSHDRNHESTNDNQSEDQKQSRTKKKQSLDRNEQSLANSQTNNNTRQNNQTSHNFQLPSNLPPEILALKVKHLLNLNLSKSLIQKTGVVVQVLKRNNSGISGGFLKPYSDRYALFSPTDSRKPRMLINLQQCPTDFSSHAQRYAKILFIACLQEWDLTKCFGIGNLMKVVGDGNQIKSRMESLLMENQIIDEDFPDDVYQELEYLDNLPQNWFSENTKDRRDLTNECIISIDPKTARDLDDAVSIRRIGDGIFEVGVHIADVSYFVKEMTAVDYHARLRTTSVYLVDRVIPMLPRILCEQMCSLNPGQPKLAFSVIWKLNKDGQILDEWFGRTIIKTCCKLAYEEAQDIIDKEGDIRWIHEGINMPQLHGGFDWSQVSRSIISLNKLARVLRKNRFKNGALRIDQVKLKYELEKETGLPTGFSFEDRTEANCLIEEMMLLANMSVAKRIYKFNDQLAVLRRHPPSSQDALKEVKEFCDAKGFPLDVSSSQSIQMSLNNITDVTISKVVSHLLLRTMKNAEYICVGLYPEDGCGFHHFALNVPFYTHFTSPIRRYADILVHRQLCLALGYQNLSYEDVNSLSMISTECSKRKISAKLVSETSQKLYFNLFVLKAGFCELLACVTKIYDHSFDVILVDYDRVGRVYLDKLKPQLKNHKFQSFSGIRRLELEWAADKNNGEQIADVEDGNITSGEYKKKMKKKLKKKEISSMNSRSHLENGKSGTMKVVTVVINEAKDGFQVIEVFDLIKVVVTANGNDITQLNIDLKMPV